MADMAEPQSAGTGFPVLKGIEILSLHRMGKRSEWLVGRQVKLERNVAIKRLKADLSGSFDLREAFIAAGRSSAGIVHPAALAIFNIFPDQDSIVMEWCGAIPLTELRGKLSGLEVVKLGVAVLDCLAALHATERSHGNLSPGNIFRDLNGQVRVSDFFQTPLLDEHNQNTQEDRSFLAPEVLDHATPDWRSDLYSLGRILEFVIDPTERPGETTRAIAEMVNADPEARGESSWSVYQHMVQARRFEERRSGVLSATLMRRQRQYSRIPAEIAITVKKRSSTPFETGIILSKVKDIGENGVFVETDDPMPVGSIVELNFSLLDDGKIHAFGLVRWIAEAPLASGMGVQFVEVDESGFAVLKNYVRNKATNKENESGNE